MMSTGARMSSISAERASWFGPVRALAARDARERRVVRFGLAVDVAFGVLNLVTFSLISELVTAPNRAQLGDAPTYFAYAAVGIVFLLVIQSATVSVARRIRDEQVAGTLEMLCAEPISPLQLALGFAAYPVSFAVVRAAGYLVVAAALLDLGVQDASLIGAAITMLLSTFALVAIGILLAALSLVARGAEQATRVVVFALGFLGGAHVPVSLLPGWLQTVSDALPTTYALQAMRAAINGGDWASPALILLAFTAVLLPVAAAVFGGAVRLAIRRGTLVRG